MNLLTFRRNALYVLLAYAITIGVGIGLRLYSPNKDEQIYATFVNLVPLWIALPAAWLAYCIQRRMAYLKDVRDLWTKIVSAVQLAIQYTHSEGPPTRAAFGTVQQALSVVIDELRAVFVNIEEHRNGIGLYPFEGLKTIAQAVSLLGFGEQFSAASASSTRSQIITLWKEFRKKFLVELPRGLPAEPDSPYVG